MTDLLTRLQGLSAPCQEVDALIEKALPPSNPRSTLPSLWNERAARYHSAGIGSWDDQNDYTPTPYTASLDAAMTLAGDGWRAVLDTALFWQWQKYHEEAKLADLPRYICIAALRARKGHEAQGGEADA